MEGGFGAFWVDCLAYFCGIGCFRLVKICYGFFFCVLSYILQSFMMALGGITVKFLSTFFCAEVYNRALLFPRIF